MLVTQGPWLPWRTPFIARVESRMGAVLEALPIARFPSPLIEPDVPISGIRLSDWIYRMSSGIGSHAGV